MITMQQLRAVLMDLDIDALKIVDHNTYAIHVGHLFTVSQISALNGLDIASPLTFHVTTPGEEISIHLATSFNVSTGVVFEVFEDNSIITDFNVSGGNPITCINRNRPLNSGCELVIASGVTVTAATLAARIDGVRCGGAFVGGTVTSGNFVLAPNTQYLFRLTSDADNNEGSLNLNWHEH